MSAELEARIRVLEQRLEAMATTPVPGVAFRTGSLSVPPTDAELESLFSDMAYSGFIGAASDGAFPIPNIYLVLRHGSGVWSYVAMT